MNKVPRTLFMTSSGAVAGASASYLSLSPSLQLQGINDGIGGSLTLSWLATDFSWLQKIPEAVQPLGHRPSSSTEGSGFEVDFGGKVTPGQGNDDAASSIHHHEADMSNTALIRVSLLLSGSYDFYASYSWKEIQVLTQSCERPWWGACECLKSDYYHSTIVVQLLIIFLSAFLMTLPSFWFSLTFTLSCPVLSPLFFLFAHSHI